MHPNGRRTSPTQAVRIECLRAVGALALSPFQSLAYLAQRPRLVREFRSDAADGAQACLTGDGPVLPERPVRIFLSCAEHSGEVHAKNLVVSLNALARSHGAREPEFVGLGSSELARVGVRILGNPLERAAMGIDPLGSLGFFAGLLRRAAEYFQRESPDVCVPIDSPALHVPLGHIAHRYGVPVVHFVTPQYWAWAPWRVRGYRRAVDLALTILPFEPAWFARNGVASAYVGHPQLDVLSKIAARAPRATAADPKSLVLLPGSREQVIDRNLPWMIAVAARVRLEHPRLEVVLPHDRADLTPTLERHLRAAGAASWVRLGIGDLHAELARARIALSVSGTILVDILYHRVPCAVIYRVPSRLAALLARRVLTVPWFSSPNLLAGRSIVPEYCFHGLGPFEEVASFLSRCVEDDSFHGQIRAELEQAAERLGPRGATERAARHVLAMATRSSRAPAPVNAARGSPPATSS